MNDLWYSEYHTDSVKFSIKVKKQLYSKKSDFQDISVFDSAEFGKFLTLDGVMMLTEKDEFIYHEMMVHVPMAVNKDIKRVLVIGAGDGGVARELSKYSQLEAIDIIEIDEEVVTVCKEYLPSTAIGFDDPRVNLIFEDGLRFVRHCSDSYDLIIVDSTDPSGPGEVLFTKEFYGNCYKVLSEKGIMVNQHESPFYDVDKLAMQEAHRCILSAFNYCKVYQAHIPTYPSGHWLFGFASKGLRPISDADFVSWLKLGINTKYYNTNLHKGAFYLPNYVEEALKVHE